MTETTTTRRVISKLDRRRLRQAIDSDRQSWRTYGPYLDWLTSRLEEAQECEPTEVPADVITMNSRVELEDLRSGETRDVTLVYPGDPRSAEVEDAVSIFEPAGLALLGSRVGDVVGWVDPERSHTARVRSLRYQPEAAGDLNL